MSSSRSNSLSALEEKRRKLDADIEARRTAIATAIGTPFVRHFGDGLNPKDAGLLAAAVQKVGVATALERLK